MNRGDLAAALINASLLLLCREEWLIVRPKDGVLKHLDCCSNDEQMRRRTLSLCIEDDFVDDPTDDDNWETILIFALGT